jgi:hypothetical protein
MEGRGLEIALSAIANILDQPAKCWDGGAKVTIHDNGRVLREFMGFPGDTLGVNVGDDQRSVYTRGKEDGLEAAARIADDWNMVFLGAKIRELRQELTRVRLPPLRTLNTDDHFISAFRWSVAAKTTWQTRPPIIIDDLENL